MAQAGAVAVPPGGGGVPTWPWAGGMGQQWSISGLPPPKAAEECFGRVPGHFWAVAVPPQRGVLECLPGQASPGGAATFYLTVTQRGKHTKATEHRTGHHDINHIKSAPLHATFDEIHNHLEGVHKGYIKASPSTELFQNLFGKNPM